MAPNGHTRASGLRDTARYHLRHAPCLRHDPSRPRRMHRLFTAGTDADAAHDGHHHQGWHRLRRHGAPGRLADVGIKGDRIERVGDLSADTAPTTIDAAGRAVAPGFINMLSWATESLLADGRSQGDIRQGVTLEIFGEGSSMGPLNDTMKKRIVEEMGDTATTSPGRRSPSI